MSLKIVIVPMAIGRGFFPREGPRRDDAAQGPKRRPDIRNGRLLGINGCHGALQAAVR